VRANAKREVKFLHGGTFVMLKRKLRSDRTGIRCFALRITQIKIRCLIPD